MLFAIVARELSLAMMKCPLAKLEPELSGNCRRSSRPNLVSCHFVGDFFGEEPPNRFYRPDTRAVWLKRPVFQASRCFFSADQDQGCESQAKLLADYAQSGAASETWLILQHNSPRHKNQVGDSIFACLGRC